MIPWKLACFLLIFLLLNSIIFAQDNDMVSAVDYKVNKMQKVLSLSDSQVVAIRPIIKDYLVKRQALLDEVDAQGIVDHVAVKSTLKTIKEDEYQKLGKILSAEQMQKWINKENMMAALNPDSPDSTVDDEGVGMTATGANFKF
jgi:hypothetical protein